MDVWGGAFGTAFGVAFDLGAAPTPPAPEVSESTGNMSGGFAGPPEQDYPKDLSDEIEESEIAAIAMLAIRIVYP